MRAPIPPGPYRLAFDMVAENRAWFSELGSPMLVQDLRVAERPGEPNADLPAGVEPAPDWQERVRAAHAEGFAVVAGAIAWEGLRRPHALAPYRAGPGPDPRLRRAAPLPLGAARASSSNGSTTSPACRRSPLRRSEPWVYDGRIVLRYRR